MTSKNPVRSCEDVDESVLSYAEIKALCIGDLRIREKMDLDIQVSKLRMLEGSHKSQQYRLQDRALKYYPREIEHMRERVTGLEKDFECWSRHSDGEFGMTVSGKVFGKDEKKEAGEAILEACNGLHGIKNTVKIGEYMGFDMTVTYSFVTQKSQISLRADGVTHQIEAGESATGNITRLDNTLEKIPERLRSAKEGLEDLHKQIENAKEELERPFPQAQELKEKSERLAELDILLNMDTQEQKEEQENELRDDQGEGQEEEEVSVPIDKTSAPEEAVGRTETVESWEPTGPAVGQRVAFRPHNASGCLIGEIVDMSEDSVTLRCGKMTIPVLRDMGIFRPAPEPNHTETKEYAEERAKCHTEEGGNVFFAQGEGAVYRGAITEVTPNFAIQKVGKNAILHRLKDLEANRDMLCEGTEVSIAKGPKGAISVELWNRDEEKSRERSALSR
jgi:hypothetical protein